MLSCNILYYIHHIELYRNVVSYLFRNPWRKTWFSQYCVFDNSLCFGFKYALGVALLRIFIIGITFTNPYMMLYSLAGGFLSISIMALMAKTHLFSNIVVSIVGGVSHNIGQLLVAFVFFSTSVFIYYLPYLILLGIVSGTVVGIIAQIIYIKIKRHIIG